MWNACGSGGRSRHNHTRGKKESDLESVVARTRLGGHVEALTIRLWCTVQNPSW